MLEQAGAGPAPFGRPAIASLLLLARPPFGAARHLSVNVMLLFRDQLREERQLLALQALRAVERRPLARGVVIGLNTGPAAETHHAASRSSSSISA